MCIKSGPHKHLKSAFMFKSDVFPDELAPRKEETHLPPCTAPAHQSFPGEFPAGIPQWNFPKELSSWREDRHLTPSRRTCPP